MKSLYDVLGVRADDDAQTIKQAFRTAVKANHPDLHPNDPDALMRFRRIVSANTVLRDAKQRAAYDQMLEFKRQRMLAQLPRQQQLLRQTQSRKERLTSATVVASVSIVISRLVAVCRSFVHPALATMSTMSPMARHKPMNGETVRKNETSDIQIHNGQVHSSQKNR